jgi:hypothetical protein
VCYLASGCGGMQANLELVGGKWWRPSMGLREGGGVPALVGAHRMGFWKFISKE